MANLYYREDLVLRDAEPGTTLTVTGDEARHAVRVARLRVGERTIVGDGQGFLAHGEVVSAEREHFSIRVVRVEHLPAAAPRIVLVQALAKGDRDERAIEQATEFGVDAIIPWQAARSVSRWDGAGGAEKSRKGVAKWARVVREAAKQSVRAYVPEMLDPRTTKQLCEEARREGVRTIVLHPKGTESLSAWLRRALDEQPREFRLIIGPEGGLDDAELELFSQAGAEIAVLGSAVLRTSSAGPAAIAALNLAFGRW